MRIVTITWARNEEDILESFIRHHARMVDKMVIILHCCEDTSYDIALRLQREGITLDIRESNASYHAQGEALTALMHEHADADWIVPLDADEFLCGAQELRSILEQAPTDTVFALPGKHTYQHQQMTVTKKIFVGACVTDGEKSQTSTTRYLSLVLLLLNRYSLSAAIRCSTASLVQHGL